MMGLLTAVGQIADRDTLTLFLLGGAVWALIFITISQNFHFHVANEGEKEFRGSP